MGMRVTVLGSGTSQGVPMIACKCPVCLSPDPKDKRLRCSIYIEAQGRRYLVDTTPDFRTQALRADIPGLDAVLYTHAHADHILGFDDLRRFCERHDTRIPIYGLPETLKQIESIFPYAFDPHLQIKGYIRVDPHPVNETFLLDPFRVTPLSVFHGSTPTCGYLFELGAEKKLAYFSDCKTLSDEVVSRLSGVEALMIDGLRDEIHATHMSVSEAIAAARRIGCKQAWLTHLTHHKTHADREKDLPPGIRISFDELQVEL